MYVQRPHEVNATDATRLEADPMDDIIAIATLVSVPVIVAIWVGILHRYGL